jgi:hypothetical protein
MVFLQLLYRVGMASTVEVTRLSRKRRPAKEGCRGYPGCEELTVGPSAGEEPADPSSIGVTTEMLEGLTVIERFA